MQLSSVELDPKIERSELAATIKSHVLHVFKTKLSEELICEVQDVNKHLKIENYIPRYNTNGDVDMRYSQGIRRVQSLIWLIFTEEECAEINIQEMNEDDAKKCLFGKITKYYKDLQMDFLKQIDVVQYKPSDVDTINGIPSIIKSKNNEEFERIIQMCDRLVTSRMLLLIVPGHNDIIQKERYESWFSHLSIVLDFAVYLVYLQYLYYTMQDEFKKYCHITWIDALPTTVFTRRKSAVTDRAKLLFLPGVE